MLRDEVPAKATGDGVGNYQELNWAGARRNPAPTPMIWVPPPVVGAPLHPNIAPVRSCILNDWQVLLLTDIVFKDFIA